MMSDHGEKANDRVSLASLDPEEALRALLKVDRNADPAGDASESQGTGMMKREALAECDGSNARSM